MSNKKFSAKYAALVLALVAAAGSLTYYLTQRGGRAATEAATVQPMVENLAVSTQSTQPSQVSSPAPSVSVPATF